MTRYVLECWNPYTRKYDKFGEYDNIERAEIMFNKSYFRTRTRRLIKVNIDVLYKERGKS